LKRYKGKDWCTLWPDRVFKAYIGDICYIHDERYRDHSKTRFEADKELYYDVKDRGLPITSTIMFIGLRLAGWYWYNKGE